ncbi:MAG TPA: RNA methyltransferase [Candidatus Krumholzibacteria bacterium]|nr:RNA methyltransferase [Candidatus Krumholzibacteria bacterium]HPD72147.1 RNA methyltransferase [Candidatus Krumholzibacteria bacterium]HRY40921.1 RNA methyltransferase [Candidatus Krumholzibacteria bacterium]
MDFSHFLPRLDAARRAELERQLRAVIRPRRLDRMEQVLARRTRRLTVLFEDLYDPHNASAVMRSAECFGVQDIHVVERERRFRPHTRVVRGAARWLTVLRYGSIDEAAAALRAGGYALVATTVDPASPPIDAVSLDRPLAVCFGTEEVGLSPAALAAADLRVHVPMVGFTESLNVSVTAALCLRALTERLRAGAGWELDAVERDALRLCWLMQEGAKARALTVKLLQEWASPC